MANFILIIDPDATRRRAAGLAARARVAFLPSLRPKLAATETYALAWAAAPHAPVSYSVATEAQGPDCILFGEPHDATGAMVTAADLRQRGADDWNGTFQLNGFYSALLIDPRRGVRAEADVLGMFPLYHWQRGEVLLISTSPDLFRCHPAFQSSLDLHGVAALLLTSGLVGGRTLWTGVRRLPADHVVFCPPGGPLCEVPPVSVDAPETSDAVEEAEEQCAALHVAFLRAALKSTQHLGLQLSGGLDSRLLAGFTTALHHRPTCLTFGGPHDLDAQCATQVAAELNLPQVLGDVRAGDYAEYARSSVETEQLSGGLYALPLGWNMSIRPPDVSIDRMICGLTLDAVVGGPKHVARAGDALSYESLRIGRLGYTRTQLDALIAEPQLGRACDEVRDELVRSYRAAGPTDHVREWRTNLAHRHRFAVGACAWRYALFAWPVMPALDRRLIRLASGLPGSVVQNRRVQNHMLVSRFPQLARLDLDRNYLDTIPLLGARRSFAYDVRRRLVKLHRRSRIWMGRDPRFYVRTMEFNSPGWRAIRTVSDEARSTAHALFRPTELAKVIPDARVTVRHLKDPILHSTPLKNTVGLMLWMRQHA